MALASGTRIGPYEIAAQIGVGGMGEVYRARDTKLGRDVAIKVLPDAVASDAERIARFEREAKTLAALNHPNIAAIHGFEESTSLKALVMEFVDGPTLADRIEQGPIPVDEALPIAKQIAEALEAAHEQGIIHRDLKPANIKVRSDGTVKVLDFGLAKAMEPVASAAQSISVSMSPTITTPAMTQAGMILGTAAYMSPEQAKGRPVDKRTDIWAFGCVIYEMLTGRRPFLPEREGASTEAGADDVAETLAAVIRGQVDWATLPASVPTPIRVLLRRCLEKDRKRRLESAADARLEIEEAIAAPASDATAGSRAPAIIERPALWRRAMVPAAALVLGGAIVGGTLWSTAVAPQGTLASGARLTIALPPGTQLDDGRAVAISPDGANIAFVGRQSGVAQLYLRPIGRLEAREVPDTRGATAPFFSPDGQWLGFFADGKLKKASTTGGVVVTLADAASGVNANAAWNSNNTIAFTGGPSGPAIVSADGGEARPLLSKEQNAMLAVRSIDVLPDAESLLVATNQRGARTVDEASIGVLAIKTGQLKNLVRGSTQAQYLPTGHLVYLRDGVLMAAPLDLARLELASQPVEAMSGVRQQVYNGAGAFSCSNGGTCVYISGGTAAERTVAIVDRTGASRTLPLPPRSYGYPRFSPSGDRISFWIEQFQCDVEVYDMARGTTTRLTTEFDNHAPVWTTDGRQIAYFTDRTGAYEIVTRPAGSGGAEAPVSAMPLRLGGGTMLSWSPTGAVAFVRAGDIQVLPHPGDAEPRTFETSKSEERNPAFSPDGRWLAYESDESGRFEVYVRPYPGPGDRYAISAAGGSEPVWARNGRELFFRSGDQMMVVDIGSQPSFTASRPRLLFTGVYSSAGSRTSYDVSPDGQSFVLLNTGEEDRAVAQITVVTNWFEELRRLVPTK